MVGYSPHSILSIGIRARGAFGRFRSHIRDVDKVDLGSWFYSLHLKNEDETTFLAHKNRSRDVNKHIVLDLIS